MSKQKYHECITLKFDVKEENGVYTFTPVFNTKNFIPEEFNDYVVGQPFRLLVDEAAIQHFIFGIIKVWKDRKIPVFYFTTRSNIDNEFIGVPIFGFYIDYSGDMSDQLYNWEMTIKNLAVFIMFFKKEGNAQEDRNILGTCSYTRTHVGAYSYIREAFSNFLKFKKKTSRKEKKYGIHERCDVPTEVVDEIRSILSDSYHYHISNDRYWVVPLADSESLVCLLRSLSVHYEVFRQLPFTYNFKYQGKEYIFVTTIETVER